MTDTSSETDFYLRVNLDLMFRTDGKVVEYADIVTIAQVVLPPVSD